MNTSKQNGLFSPIALGTTHLKHRVVMAPLTRSRSVQPEGIPGDLMLEYYTQRTSDGGLIIAEAAQLSVATRGWHGAPGMYTDGQVEGWKRIVDGVHSKGGRMFAQLWHPGRFSHISLTGGAAPVSASVDPEYWENPSRLISTPHGWIQPSPHRAIETSEIPCVLELYSGAVKHARAAVFDGVEVHAGNGYFIDQFLQDGSNKRTDEYGGPIENRTRLLFEVVDAMVSAWSGDHVAVRITPGGTFNAMTDSDPEALHSHIAQGLTRFGLAYLHFIEPRMSGSMVIRNNQPPIVTQRARSIYKKKSWRTVGSNQVPPLTPLKKAKLTQYHSGGILFQILICQDGCEKNFRLQPTTATRFTLLRQRDTQIIRSTTEQPESESPMLLVPESIAMPVRDCVSELGNIWRTAGRNMPNLLG